MERITLSHGSGGMLTSQLISSHILKRFGNQFLDMMDDSAVLPPFKGRMAFTTDSFVVTPIFFPGGNIGDLAVCGTVNDLSMSGAVPRFISLGLIIEEGFAFSDLEKILDSIKSRAEEANVRVVCGDTKVVGKGQADGIFINTSGIGEIAEGVNVSSHNIKPGDALILSGAPGLHGLAVMLARANFHLDSPVTSDAAPLNKIIQDLLSAGIELHALRDPTRGGVSAALHDFAENSSVTLEIMEERIPLTAAQESACDLLGLDYLNIASEGRVLVALPERFAEKALAIMHACPYSAQAAVIGKAIPRGKYPVELVTAIGSRRIVTVPRGEQMPRIC